jgi:hypothetical protein
MLANFKKFGVAAAVASALGAAGAAQAFSLGDPADALLIPYVFAGANAKGVVTNTLVGLVVANPANVNLGQFADFSVNPPVAPDLATGNPGSIGHGTLTPGSKFNGTTPWCTAGRLHWYFFNIDSQEVADGTINVTCEDFVRLDWNYITDQKFPSAKGVPGYMVISDDIGGSTRGGVSGLVLYGAAYQIRGNWGSQAFIPAVPLVDSVDGTVGDEVTHSGAFVTNVIPVTAGLSLPYQSATSTADQSWFSLRYFLDPALNGATTFVLWFPDTAYQTRLTQQVVVFDADELPVSAATSAPHELNLIQVDPTANPAKPSAPHTAVLRDGLTHTNTDGSGTSAVGSAVNTGFVLFDVHDRHSSGSVVVDGNTIFEGATVYTPFENSRAGFAFSLIGIGGGSAPDQVQTELAHERGLK